MKIIDWRSFAKRVMEISSNGVFIRERDRYKYDFGSSFISVVPNFGIN